jgi:hypothetical protein
MTDREQYKKVFDTAVSAGMENLEAGKLMENTKKLTKKTTFIGKIAAAIAAVVLMTGVTGVAYAADVGGIQRTIQLWIHGDQTQATIEINQNGSYSMEYTSEDGNIVSRGGGGVAFDENGNESALTEDEIIQGLTRPYEVEYEEDGTVWVYFYDQKIDITDKFTDGVCYIKLVNGDDMFYMTIKYKEGYGVSPYKYIQPESFNTQN